MSKLSINKFMQISFLISLTVIITITSELSFVDGQTTPVKLYSIDSAPFGMSYGNWISKWWQWSVNIPLEGHPRDSYSPEKCAINQNGPAWFLPDILAGDEQRTCVIPVGTAVLIPIITRILNHTDGMNNVTNVSSHG